MASGDAVYDFTVQAITDKLGTAGYKKVSAIRESMAALQREERRLMDGRKRVLIGMPGYSKNHVERDAWFALTHTPSDNEQLITNAVMHCNSLLARGMNMLYAQAMYQDYDCFAMLHTDVAPEQHWLDKMYQCMVEYDADVLSAVIPIKSPEGVTSTAIDLSAGPSPWQWHVRRLTMAEIHQLPETFGQAETVEAGLNPDNRMMLVNTGCMLINLRKPWVKARNEAGHLKCYFTIDDSIQITPRGQYHVRVVPEDWNFSRMVQTVAPEAKVLATRAVRISHWGEAAYPNYEVWGTQTEDHWRDGLAEITETQEPVAETGSDETPTGIQETDHGIPSA